MCAPCSIFAMDSISNTIMCADAILELWLETYHGNFCSLKEQRFIFLKSF